MAKKKKSGSQGIQAIKAKQRAKKLATKAKNRAIKSRELEEKAHIIATADKMIVKGYDEGFVYVGKYSPSMSYRDKLRMARRGELNPMKIRQAQELGLHGNVGLGRRGLEDIGDTLLPSGIKRSQINKNRPATILLAERINKTFEDLPKMFAEKKVYTSQTRAVDLKNRMRYLYDKGLLVDTGRKVFGTNVYEQRIDIDKFQDYYMNADEKEREKLDLNIRVINEGPEMSEAQYDYWRRDTVINAEKLGTTENELRFTDMVLNTTGLFEAAKKEPDPSNMIKEARSMTAFIENREEIWDKEFKSKLQAVIDCEKFDDALKMLKEQGYRTKYIE